MSTQPGGQSGGPSGPAPAGGGPARSFWSGIELLWELDAQPGRPRRRAGTALDREQIVREAIRIADADGLEAVTMRRVAQQLGTGAMSLYRHVPDKDALVSLMVDTVIGDMIGEAPPLPELPPGMDWRDGLRMIAEGSWRTCREHRWYPEATIAQPPLTPNGLAGLEAALGLFDGYGLTIVEKMMFVTAVHQTVLHAALNLEMEERSRARFQLDDAEVFAGASAFLGKITASGRYPRVTELFGLFGGQRQNEDTERDWILAGVDLILDGIAARLAQRTSGAPLAPGTP
jgi:AcrR family transcriptional regulator